MRLRSMLKEVWINILYVLQWQIEREEERDRERERERARVEPYMNEARIAKWWKYVLIGTRDAADISMIHAQNLLGISYIKLR